MLYGSLFAYILRTTAQTIIIPAKHLNHRMTFSDGPLIINSSVNENTRINDYFTMDDQITYLLNNNTVLCHSKSGDELSTCNRSSSNRVPWKIKDSVRKVQFENEAGNCLTAGEYTTSNDTFKAVEMPCDKNNPEQWFILNSDHGQLGLLHTLNHDNIENTSDALKETFIHQDKLYNYPTLSKNGIDAVNWN